MLERSGSDVGLSSSVEQSGRRDSSGPAERKRHGSNRDEGFGAGGGGQAWWSETSAGRGRSVSRPDECDRGLDTGEHLGPERPVIGIRFTLEGEQRTQLRRQRRRAIVAHRGPPFCW